MSVSIDTSAVLSAPSEPKEMLSVSQDGEVTSVRINFSSLSLLQECARKSQYSLVRGLKPRLETPALLFGSAIHKGLEVYYSGERTERRIPKDYASVMEMIGCGRWEADWEEHLVFRAARAFVLKAAPLSALLDNNKRSISTGVWMLRHYMELKLTDEWVIMRDAEGPMVERKVTMPLYSSPDLIITFFGQIDFVMRSEVTGEILPGDHKTASQVHKFFSKCKPNFQYVGYNWAAREVLRLDTDRFIVNILEVKPPYKDPSRAKKKDCPDFFQQIVTCTDEDRNELKMAIIDVVRDFLRNKARNFFPMSTGACVNAYGECQFHEICSAPTQLRETIITAKYQGGSYAAQ